jgi:preprotein translocase SecE subunit
VWPSRQQLFSESVAVILMATLSAFAIAAVSRFNGWASSQSVPLNPPSSPVSDVDFATADPALAAAPGLGDDEALAAAAPVVLDLGAPAGGPR